MTQQAEARMAEKEKELHGARQELEIFHENYGPMTREGSMELAPSPFGSPTKNTPKALWARLRLWVRRGGSSARNQGGLNPKLLGTSGLLAIRDPTCLYRETIAK